jgi:hypothetical protein
MYSETPVYCFHWGSWKKNEGYGKIIDKGGYYKQDFYKDHKNWMMDSGILYIQEW